MLMGTCVAGLAESLALADKVGLDQDALLQILDLSVMSCPLIRAKGQGEQWHILDILSMGDAHGKRGVVG